MTAECAGDEPCREHEARDEQQGRDGKGECEAHIGPSVPAANRLAGRVRTIGWCGCMRLAGTPAGRLRVARGSEAN